MIDLYIRAPTTSFREWLMKGLAAFQFAIGLGCVFIANSLFAQQPNRPKIIYKPIVLSGQVAPSPTNRVFRSFPYHSVINDANQITFLATMVGGFFPDAIYLSDRDGIHNVAYVGEPAPGFAEGVKIQSFDINYHRANEQGQVVFESTVNGPGILSTGDDNSNAFANWFWSGGSLQPIAKSQSPAPGTDARFRTFGQTTIDDLGNVAFFGDLIGEGVTLDSDTAYWYGPPDDLRLLAREGAAAPGNVVFGELSLDYPVLSGNGGIIFNSYLADGGRGLFAGRGESLQLIAKTGDAVPGTDVAYRDIQGHGVPPRINRRGDVAFASSFSDGRVALLSGAPGAIEVVARTGEFAPDLTGLKFDFFFGYGINDRG